MKVIPLITERERFQIRDLEIQLLLKENKRLKRTSASLAHDLKNHIQALLWTIESSNYSGKNKIFYNRLLDQTMAMKDTVGMIMESGSSYSFRSLADPIFVINETALIWKDKLRVTASHKSRLELQKIEAAVLRQIMINLFSNSVKHSGKNPVGVFIGIRVIANKISFSYYDDGVGLPEHIILKLNELKPAANPGIESGTGLWLIRELVIESGGALRFLNGKICFELPLFKK